MATVTSQLAIDVAAQAQIAADSALCQACGACCAYDESWPRFSLESEAEIAAIPLPRVSTSGSGMRCTDHRCDALAGEIGRHAICTVYAVRPLVCRDCQPGDEECVMARARHGLPELPPR